MQIVYALGILHSVIKIQLNYIYIMQNRLHEHRVYGATEGKSLLDQEATSAPLSSTQ